ncbi:MAG: hypothetical protein Ta2G_11770 [Termitinemataceae bacterium]|nr:MAG: hypothetical protein Ta2G_11770 [Termitinemataceae bacterium]
MSFMKRMECGCLSKKGIYPPPPPNFKRLSWVVCAFISAFVLIFAACKQPTDPNTDNTPPLESLKKANEFKADYAAILEKTEDTITESDETDLDDAIVAYAELSDDVKALLTTEKAKLDALKDKIEDIRDGARTPYTTPVQYVNFGGASSKDITLNGLSGNSIYIVQMNGGTTSSTAGTAQTKSSNVRLGNRLNSAGGGADNFIVEHDNNVNGIFTDSKGKRIVRHEKNFIDEFAKNPIPASKVGGGINYTFDEPSDPTLKAVNITGDKKKFWVQNASGAWQQIWATLRTDGTNCDVWVADDNYSTSSTASNDNKITLEQARAIRDKFDAIYTPETTIFGKEYGGVGSGTPYGGVDSNSWVQILIYDIDFDYTPTQPGGVFGFFNMLDEFSQADINAIPNLSGNKTNQAEIIYIDSHFTDSAPSAIYSTLVHEFQHLINFNQKIVLAPSETPVYSTWFAETLSQLAEDLISPSIGIPLSDSGHPVSARIPLYLAIYDQSPVMGAWLPGDAVYYSYASVYAFGAYLARNYGGANFVKTLAQNRLVDGEAIDTALKSPANPHGPSSGSNPKVDTIAKAFQRYGEALVFSGTSMPTSVMSFDKSTIAQTISGKSFKYEKFNLRKMSNGMAGYNGMPAYYRGPYIKPANQSPLIAPIAPLVQSLDEWQNVTGNITITVNKPSSSDIDVYLMVR